jgi:hypothetical protein
LPNYEPSYKPRVRIEVYFPIRDEHVYEHYLEWFIDELTRVYGGCTVLENMSGFYNSDSNGIVADRINVVYSDFKSDWSEVVDRAEVLDYCAKLRVFLLEKLLEKEVLITAYPVSHVSQ